MVTVRNHQPLDISLNLNVRGMTPSATVAINERSDDLRRQGRPVFKLGLGQSPFPVPEPVVEALRENAWRKDYLPVRGLRELREKVANYHWRVQGLESTAADILIGPGSKELMFLLQLVYYGDLVVPTPAWVSYVPQAHIIGRQVALLPTAAGNGWHLTAAELERRCQRDPRRPRIVVLNYPSNPTGGTYRLEDLRELARVARRHRVVLLSDEIYGELHHKGQHVSIARFYPEGTIVSSGLSKWCGAGGWRLGTFRFPPALHWLMDAMAAVASETYTSTSAPIQYAAVRAFAGGDEIERYLTCSRRVLSALGRWCARRLTEAGAHVAQPVGAFYLFPDFTPLADRLRARGVVTGSDLCERLLAESGVAILPGKEFGRPDTELTARIAYVDFDGAAALAACPDHGRPPGVDFLRRSCGPVLAAVDRLCDWLAG